MRALIWREHARADRHVDAMAALDDATFAATVARASAAELRSIADSARLGRRPDRARQALLAVRQRHGARGESAFLLGKIAADQLGASAEAMRWFQTCLEESPTGPLAEQAMGRMLELQSRGNPEAAAALARAYLSRYPQGSHAPLAQRLAGP